MNSPGITIEDVNLQIDKSGRYIEGKVEMTIPGSREIVEVLNITNVQQVICTVAYHTSPFRIQPADKDEEVLVALSQWGEKAVAGFERTVVEH